MSSVERLTTDILSIAGQLPTADLRESQIATDEAAELVQTSRLPEHVTAPLRQAADHLTAVRNELQSTAASLFSYLGVIGAENTIVYVKGQAGNNESGETAETPAMSDRRPGWLTQIIDEQFAEIEALMKKYRYHGQTPDYNFGYAKATELIREYRQRAKQNRPLRVLDVGTGAGGFIAADHWQEGDMVQGISAYDYRRNNGHAASVLTEDDPRYIIGNAEYLDTIPNLLPKYDVIVSHLTLQHFIDGIGSLEQILNRAAPGGLVCLDIGPGFAGIFADRIAELVYARGFTPFHVEQDKDSYGRFLVAVRSNPDPIRFEVGYERASFEGYREHLTPREKRRLSLDYQLPPKDILTTLQTDATIL